MKRAELFHPRVFDSREWAEGYYKRNRLNITRVGRDFASLLKKSRFTEGKILDVGCGFAAVPIEIARVFPGAEITGVDLGLPLLELGRKLVEEAGLSDQITLLEGNAHDLSYERDSFDVVINTFMLHVVDDPVTMLNEIERVARPEARILMRDLRRGLLAYVMKKFRTSFTIEEALEIIEKSDIREGRVSRGLFWWDFMAGM
ncbi:MAG TPA: class I SAM-dependent methyltransferase [Bacteroides sp.]|nr:class I SAM-dependent methyltransferase [Bacteroides sp.]